MSEAKYSGWLERVESGKWGDDEINELKAALAEMNK